MQLQHYTKPGNILFLVLPSGISSGFVTVALPFLLTKNGFPVATTAGIIALGVSSNLWRFLWGPVVDLSLSLKKWYWIGFAATAASLILLCFTPFTVKGALLLSVIVFISQVAGTFMLLPVNSFMVKSIEANKKGQASGWYQAGSLLGTGIGGGAGLWLAEHYKAQVAGLVLCGMSFIFALVIFFIKDINHNKNKTILQGITGMGKDIFEMLKIPVALYAIVLFMTPIGSGASANIWSAIATDWKTGADTVALVTGILSGLVSALGCIAGGYIADKWGVWKAYLGCGAFCALAAFVMAVMPFIPAVYISGVLIYAFSTGLIYAAFTALILFVIGKKHAATKYSLLASLGNISVVYMTASNGWVHDAFNSKYMLLWEAFAGILFVILFSIILKRMKKKNMVPEVIQ